MVPMPTTIVGAAVGAASAAARLTRWSGRACTCSSSPRVLKVWAPKRRARSASWARATAAWTALGQWPRCAEMVRRSEIGRSACTRTFDAMRRHRCLRARASSPTWRRTSAPSTTPSTTPSPTPSTAPSMAPIPQSRMHYPTRRPTQGPAAGWRPPMHCGWPSARPSVRRASRSCSATAPWSPRRSPCPSTLWVRH